ncbi:MAG: hypothetical protein HN368_02675 [Spirochaetales bacterium]|jgi:hypothetical protein|nr:hypothetical protein [Spirochaetales bacterium]
MRKQLILLALLIAPLPAGADELWNRAVARFSMNSGWIAGKTEVVSENYNRKGKLKSIERRFTRSRPQSGGAETEILFVEKDGVDVTAEEREKAEKERIEQNEEDRTQDENSESGSGSDTGFPNPFDPNRQDVVEYQRNGKTLRVDGVSLVGFDFSMQVEEETVYVGVAFLDPDTGTPVELEATMDPLPRFADFVRLYVQFNNERDRWHANYIEIEGAGGWLLIYRHFKSSISFSDYFRAES